MGVCVWSLVLSVVVALLQQVLHLTALQGRSRSAEAALPPSFKYRDGDSVAEVQAALPG